MQNPEFGDCVGIENSVDIELDLKAPQHGAAIGRRHRLMRALKKDFPPPITSLVCGEVLPLQVPLVMKRYRTIDGRLIIKEERVEHHDFFFADRSNGRFVLSLVHVDSGIGEGNGEAEDIREIHGVDEGKSDLTVEDVAAECYKYNGVALKPCGGFSATASVLMPPVHT